MDVINELKTARIIEEIYPLFKKFGELLRMRGYNSASSGNISTRRGSKMYITRRGSMKGYLEPSDIIETSLESVDTGIVLASTETYVHKNILLRTPALATMHCHPPNTVSLSIYYTEVLKQDYIVPIDVEGHYLLKKIPIVTLENPTGSKEMEEKIPEALEKYNLVILRGHGVFARGMNLEDAYNWITICEEASTIIFKCLQLGMDVKGMQGQYGMW
ncbi:MAG: class II aldolase/adducin family protein [Promethearchaeota archaeon]